MQRVTLWQTRDGINHATPDAAQRHAENVYGQALCKLAAQFVSVGRYRAMCEAIDTALNAGTFAELQALRDDCTRPADTPDD